MQTYTIYIMRVSGLRQARGLRKIGVAKNVEHRRQSIENSLRKEFGKDCLVYIEHAYEIPRKGKGGFKAYNLEHQIQRFFTGRVLCFTKVLRGKLLTCFARKFQFQFDFQSLLSAAFFFYIGH